VLLSLWAAFHIGETTRHELFVAPDSASYVGMADNIRRGDGPTVPFTFIWDPYSVEGAYHDLGHAPSSHFPPGYPAVLAALASAAGTTHDAARVLDVICVALNLVLIGLLTAKITRFGSVIVATIPPAMMLFVSDSGALGSEQFGWLPIHQSIASEPLFTVFVTATIFAAGSAMREDQCRSRRMLAITATLAGVACVTRYSGVGLVAAIAMALVCCDPVRSASQGLRRAAIFILVATAPVVVFAVGVAAAGGGGVRLLGVHPEAGFFTGILELIGRSVVPIRWPDAVLAAVAVLLLGLTGAAAIGVLGNFGRSTTNDLDIVLLRCSALAVVSYVGAVWFAQTFLDKGIVPEPRYFVGVRGLWTVAVVVVLFKLGTALARPALVAALLAVAVALVVHADWPLQRQWNHAVPAVSPSTVDRALAAIPHDSLLVTSRPDYVYLTTRRPALLLPARRVYVTGLRNGSFDRDTRELARLLRGRGGYVFYRESIVPVLTESELARAVPLDVIARSSDAVLYVTRPDR
jgi:hypothetical protein